MTSRSRALATLLLLLVSCGSDAKPEGATSSASVAPPTRESAARSASSASTVASAPLSASASAAPPAHAFANVRRDLDLSLNGAKLGTAIAEHVALPDGGVEEKGTFRMQLKIKDDNPAVREMTQEESSKYDANLRLVESSSVDREGDTVGKKHVTISKTTARVEIDKPSHHEDKTIDIPADFDNELAVFIALKREAEAGAKLPLERRFSEIDDDSATFVPHRLKLVERATVKASAGSVDGWRLEVTNERDGDTVKGVVDNEGLPLHIEIGGIVMALPGTIKQSDDVAEINPEIEVSGGFSEARDTLKVDFVVDHDEGVSPPIFLDGPYQSVARKGNTYTLTLKARRPAKPVTAPTLPMKDVPADVARFLKSSADSQSDDPAIVAKLKEIIGTETDSKKAAGKIAYWVFKNLTKADGVRGSASAVETLAAMRGDCTEHAALVVALARAAGIPARNTSGIVLIPGKKAIAGYHAWPELWLGDWVILDAALGNFDVGATYVFMAYDEPGEPEPAGMIRLVGRTKVVFP
ncbi:MAG: transglutaminase-like domain-containing protein [Polyangiaceae bacterium]